jgi:hypothetical protein
VLVKNDTLFFIGQDGIGLFPLSLFDPGRKGPKVKIEKIITAEGTLLPVSENLALRYSDNYLDIYFKAISFSSRRQLQYIYRLHSFDNWKYLNASVDHLQFSSLNPGSYRLEIVAVDSEGNFSENTAILNFQILPPFWQTWWFIFSIALVAASLMSFIFYSRFRYLKRKTQEHTILIESQLTALKAQMNPHFLFNAVTSIQDLVLQNDKAGSYQYLSRFSDLLRRILETSDSFSISLQKEIEIIELYLSLEKLRFGNEFSYRLIISEELEPDIITIPSLIIQPFVENAIKHGLLHKKGEKHLSVELFKDDKLTCIITDNGIGRERSAEIRNRQNAGHRSFATNATKKRFELLNQFGNNSIEIIDLREDDAAAGTRVIIRFENSFVNSKATLMN